MISASQLTTIILAGGNSRRMKTDKRLVELKEIRLIEWVITLAEQVSETVLISANDHLKEFRDHRVVPDINDCSGPLTGLVSALQHVRSTYVLVLSCDMPFVTVPLLKLLSSDTLGKNYTAFTINQAIQPFPAIFCASLTKEITRFHAEGERAFKELLKCIPTQLIEFEKDGKDVNEYLIRLETFIDPPRYNLISPEMCFLNINSPNDLANAINFLV